MQRALAAAIVPLAGVQHRPRHTAPACCLGFVDPRGSRQIPSNTKPDESAESVANPAAAAFGGMKLFKQDRSSVERSRNVVVLLGITGAGKSSLGNALCGARQAFSSASSVASVTSAAAVRDYNFAGNKWRVIDTPGLLDTGVDAQVTREEIEDVARYAPHGIDCVVVVVKKGRFTDEQVKAVQDALEILGGERVLPHCMLAVTSSTDPQEKLLDDIAKLPRSHGLRRLATMLGDRVLPVESVKEPARTVSRMLMHNGFMELREANDNQRYQRASVRGGPYAGLQEPGSHAAKLVLKRCDSSWDEEQLRLTTVCHFE